MADQIYYIVDARIWAVEGPHTYTLWFLDRHRRNDQQVADWRSGKYVPTSELIAGVHLDFTAGTATPHVFDHKAKKDEVPLVATLLDDALGEMRNGRLAIHHDLWKRIPEAMRPLPDKRAETYRIELVRVDATTSYLGVHAQVLDVDRGEQRIAFYSWQNKLEADHWVDPMKWTDGTFGQRSTLTSASAIGATGAIYVKTSELTTFGLSIPKVPWGTQE